MMNALTPNAPADSELLKLARAGNVRSMGLLLERHRASLHAHVLNILGYTAHDDAEDLIQETFLQALNKVSQLQNPDAFRWWLHAILRNTCFRHVRRKRLDVLPLTDDVPDVPDDAHLDHSCSISPVQDQVWGALELLPEHLRVTVLLRHFGSANSYEGIAEALAIPVGTVRSRLNKAHALLAQILQSVSEEDGGRLRERSIQKANDFVGRLGLARGGEMKAVLELFSEGMTLVVSPKVRKWGRKHLETLLLDDVANEIGYQFGPLLFSKGISIVEIANINPPHNPMHCPPASTIVLFDDSSVVQRMHVYNSSRVAAISTPRVTSSQT